MLKSVWLGRPSDGKALEEARRAYACKRPGGYFSGPFTALGCEEGWMLSVGCCALWLLPKQPTVAHIRANAARSLASCSLPRLPDFRGAVTGLGKPHPEKGGLYMPSQRIVSRKEKGFFTAIRCRLFCPRWLHVVFCRTCRGAGGAGRAQRVCVDAGCPSHRRPSPTLSPRL